MAFVENKQRGQTIIEMTKWYAKMIRHMSLATTFRSLKQALSLPSQKKEIL